MRTLIAVVSLAGTLLIGFFFLYAFSPLGASHENHIIEIRRGESQKEILAALHDASIISNNNLFTLTGKIFGKWKKIKAGEYQLSERLSPLETFDLMSTGTRLPHPLTVREGENMYEIADDLLRKELITSKEQFISLCKDPSFITTLKIFNETPPSLEGYLFPDTYFFQKDMKPQDMIHQMLHRFDSVWQKMDASPLSMHEIITLASIIEKETGAPHERPLISSVFHNRLSRHMRLQSDPTTIYGMWHRYHGKIHHEDLLEKNSFNTYTLPGLPIGPIANPGLEAIKAAIHPAQSTYLFFVSHNDGTHEFSTNYNDHTQAVRTFQIDPKARLGKSWRDLNKKH